MEDIGITAATNTTTTANTNVNNQDPSNPIVAFEGKGVVLSGPKTTQEAFGQIAAKQDMEQRKEAVLKAAMEREKSAKLRKESNSDLNPQERENDENIDNGVEINGDIDLIIGNNKDSGV